MCYTLNYHIVRNLRISFIADHLGTFEQIAAYSYNVFLYVIYRYRENSLYFHSRASWAFSLFWQITKTL